MLYKIVNGNVAIDFSNKLVQVNRATRHSHSFYHPKLRPSSSKAFYPGGGYFLVKDYWGYAAGWGRIFTTGLTIMGLHF